MNWRIEIDSEFVLNLIELLCFVERFQKRESSFLEQKIWLIDWLIYWIIMTFYQIVFLNNRLIKFLRNQLFDFWAKLWLWLSSWSIFNVSRTIDEPNRCSNPRRKKCSRNRVSSRWSNKWRSFRFRCSPFCSRTKKKMSLYALIHFIDVNSCFGLFTHHQSEYNEQVCLYWRPALKYTLN